MLVPQAQKEDCEDDDSAENDDSADDSAESSEATEFRIGMRLEAKDRKNPTLVCVASIKEDGKELKIHFDQWGNGYDYWCQLDSTDIHPVGWCEENGKELQAPLGELIVWDQRQCLHPTSLNQQCFVWQILIL